MSAPSFRFRLERVRALRERSEDAAKEAVAGALAARLHSERELEDAMGRIVRARSAQLNATATATNALDLLAHQVYLERTEKAHDARQEDLRRRDLVLAQRRQELTAAARERQALERLKEHRRSDHVRELARLESIALDEIAINSFRRRPA